VPARQQRPPWPTPNQETIGPKLAPRVASPAAPWLPNWAIAQF
jgi:hypothetical protein